MFYIYILFLAILFCTNPTETVIAGQPDTNTGTMTQVWLKIPCFIVAYHHVPSEKAKVGDRHTRTHIYIIYVYVYVYVYICVCVPYIMYLYNLYIYIYTIYPIVRHTPMVVEKISPNKKHKDVLMTGTQRTIKEQQWLSNRTVIIHSSNAISSRTKTCADRTN